MMGNSLKTILLDDRALIFGGAYGNLQATQAILTYAKTHGFRSDQIVFTGDLVAYCGQPQETTDIIRQSVDHILMGNCEESLSEGKDDCGCGFEDGTACSVLSAQWFSFCQGNLDVETKTWMGSLPRFLELRIGGYSLLCTHGTPESINTFVFPSDIDGGAYSPPADQNFDGYVVGHSGIPFIANHQQQTWINSGAAGMPANDGTPRIWFATLEAGVDGLTAQTHALDYPHDAAIDAMGDAGLSNGYKDCLSSGIWPSHDVLPEVERNQTGIRLETQKKVLRKAPSLAAVV